MGDVVEITTSRDENNVDIADRLLDLAKRAEAGEFATVIIFCKPSDPETESTIIDIGMRGSFTELLGSLEQMKQLLLIRSWNIAQLSDLDQ